MLLMLLHINIGYSANNIYKHIHICARDLWAIFRTSVTTFTHTCTYYVHVYTYINTYTHIRRIFCLKSLLNNFLRCESASPPKTLRSKPHACFNHLSLLRMGAKWNLSTWLGNDEILAGIRPLDFETQQLA